ncbi:hypothetical protein OROGR_019776 [Orobanche gracilis]
MDPRSSGMPNTVNELEFDDENFFASYEQSHINANGPNPDDFVPSSTVTYESVSPDDQDSDPVMKFLNQILIEENMEEKPSMFHDPLALQAAEKSLYEVIGQKYPPSPYHPGNYGDQPLDNPDTVHGVCSDSQLGLSTVKGSKDKPNNQMISFGNTNLLPKNFSDTESILQFKRGMEEASKFLPTNNHLITDLDKYELPQKSEDVAPAMLIEFSKDDINGSPYNGLKGSKQSATYVDDTELSEMFDRVLLCTDIEGDQGHCSAAAKLSSGLKKVMPNGSNGGRARARRKESQKDSVDLRTLLVSCAQSAAGDDCRTACEQLKEIGIHASPIGDVYQRLASLFVTGLQARISGTGTELYTSLSRRNITAADKLKAYQVYLSSCPFKKMSIFFACKNIASVASEATTIHIIDFGILYGFQWPVLIQLLSGRAGGSPKLRITGIELPQPGFRPSERVEETGVRLAKYCERFGVPFEYQVIASRNWETIKIEDLKIVSGEVLAVNCMFRFGRLLDETLVAGSPRDRVLRLIRKLKPALFVHAVTSGSYSASFFSTRFREALFHYSALLDMFDAVLPRESLPCNALIFNNKIGIQT